MSADFLLISDLDDTFLGNSEALARFDEYYQTVQSQLAIVYASGRFFKTIERDVETTHLPVPVAVIGGVGSEIRRFPGGELDTEWVRRISQNWSAERVQEVLMEEKNLQRQPESAQSDFKVSYFFDNASPEQLDRLKAKLFDEGVNVSLVYSSQRDLDFLPAGVNKGTAAAFVARELGYDCERTIVAGNSGNDSKLFEHDFYGIVVANAHDELKQYEINPRVYLSPYERADGVLDGLQHWMKKRPGQHE